jgi:hypothetical protein
MKTARLLIAVALVLVTAAVATRAQDKPAPSAEQLGKVVFPTSCSPAAQPAFERALAMLHSFEASLQAAKNRRRGTYGAARASALAGDKEKARTYYTRLVALAQNADGERPELRVAKTFFGAR